MYSQQKRLVIKAVKNYNIACKIQYYNESHKENYILKDRKAILSLIKQMAEINYKTFQFSKKKPKGYEDDENTNDSEMYKE